MCSEIPNYQEQPITYSALSLGYESRAPWPLTEVETPGVPYSQYVERMRLNPDNERIRVNDSLILAGIPAKAFEYQLGSRSAVEWIIDQYRVKGELNPNREDNPGYIVRLVGQVVGLSVETVDIVASLPSFMF